MNEGWNKETFPHILDKLHSCTEELDLWGRRIRSRNKAELQNCQDMEDATVYMALMDKLGSLVV